jgi:enamine deaminase RidA (YjgF/YER057c/UK114 family)
MISTKKTIKERMAEAGLTLPAYMPPAYAYRSVVAHGGVAYVSGHVPKTADGDLNPGKLGRDVTLEQGRAAAELATLNALSSLDAALGSLERVERVLKIVVFVASAPGFADQPKVADAASALLNTIFGDDDRHARSAVGVAELPRNSSVEVEMIVALATQEG